MDPESLRALRGTPSNPEITRNTRATTSNIPLYKKSEVVGSLAAFDKMQADREKASGGLPAKPIKASGGSIFADRLMGKKPSGVDHLKGGGIYGTLGRKRRPMSTAMFRGGANPFQSAASEKSNPTMIVEESSRNENMSYELRLVAEYFQQTSLSALNQLSKPDAQQPFQFFSTMVDTTLEKPKSVISYDKYTDKASEYEAWEEHLLDAIAKEAFSRTGAIVGVSDLRSKSRKDMMAEAEQKIQKAQEEQQLGAPPSLGVSRMSKGSGAAGEDSSPVGSLRGHPERRGSKTLSTKWSTLTRTKKNAERRSSRELFTSSSSSHDLSHNKSPTQQQHVRSPSNKSPRAAALQADHSLKRRSISTSSSKSPRNTPEPLDRSSGSKRRTATAAASKSPRDRVGSHDKSSGAQGSPLPIPKSTKSKVSRTPTLRRKRANSKSPQVQSPPSESGFPGMKVKTVSDFDELAGFPGMKVRTVSDFDELKSSSSPPVTKEPPKPIVIPPKSEPVPETAGFLDDVDKLALRLDLQQQELKTDKKKGSRLSTLKSPRATTKEKLGRLSFTERMAKRVSPRKFDSPISPRRKNKSPRPGTDSPVSPRRKNKSPRGKSPRVTTSRAKSPRLEDLMLDATMLDSNPLHAFGLVTPRGVGAEAGADGGNSSSVEEI